MAEYNLHAEPSTLSHCLKEIILAAEGCQDLAWKTNLCLRVYFPHEWKFSPWSFRVVKPHTEALKPPVQIARCPLLCVISVPGVPLL